MQQKAQKNKKTSFPTEIVEIANLYKHALKKIITTQEKCVKYDFVAPLTRKYYFC